MIERACPANFHHASDYKKALFHAERAGASQRKSHLSYLKWLIFYQV
jgi:hypothetical protein